SCFIAIFDSPLRTHFNVQISNRSRRLPLALTNVRFWGVERTSTNGGAQARRPGGMGRRCRLGARRPSQLAIVIVRSSTKEPFVWAPFGSECLPIQARPLPCRAEFDASQGRRVQPNRNIVRRIVEIFRRTPSVAYFSVMFHHNGIRQMTYVMLGSFF